MVRGASLMHSTKRNKPVFLTKEQAMTSQEIKILEQILLALEEDRRTLCVDGDSSFQSGFSMGYDCAQRVVESFFKRS